MRQEPAPYQLLDLLQISDRSFPTGGFVHSQGLEWLLKQQVVSLETALGMRLQEQLAHFELIFLVQAYRMDPGELDERFHTMIMAHESREASMQVGRQLLRNACDLFGQAKLDDQAVRLRYCHHPIVFGCVGRALNVPARTAALTYAFQAVRGQISAAQRLTRLGQTEAQRLLHRVKPAIEDAVETALSLSIDDAAPFMPLLDIAAMAHERSAVRLFVS